MIQPAISNTLCLKCDICTAACPVAAVTDRFPGPKAAGPQAERFRHPRFPMPDRSVDYCSGCGTCSQVCPHGVHVAEINILAKGRLASERKSALRDQLISRPEALWRLMLPVAHIANLTLHRQPARWVLERALGLSRHAPLPTFASRPLRKRLYDRCIRSFGDVRSGNDQTVAYFHGCSSNYYEPEIGEKAVALLEQFGMNVILPPQICCGLPLQSNGLLVAARRYAETNIKMLAPFAKEGIPIVGSSTSCTLMLKHDYINILGMDDENARTVANSTYDLFEFFYYRMRDDITRASFNPVAGKALYHPPCQLRSHGVGVPALDIIRRIPGLSPHLSESDCCGMAGTYGMKREKYQIAFDVGKTLFEQAQQMAVDFVLSDSEACRWWITKHTDIPALHPLEIVYQSIG